MLLEILDSGPPLTEERLANFEINIDKRLPEDYRQFLLNNNGGHPVLDGFSFLASQNDSNIDQFLGLDVGAHSNLEKYLKIYSGRIPIDFCPIAHDPNGNLVVLGLAGSHQNKVYFWDHELEVDDRPADMSNMYLVADSFEEFIDKLTVVED